MPSVRLLLASSLAVAVALPSGDATAASVAPTGDQFKIWYYKTDEQGDRKQYFSSQDLTGYINRARCECAQDISTRILLSPASGGTYDNTKAIRTYVGSRCNEAVGTVQQQVKPCLKVHEGYANAYTKAINFNFAPIWLAGGVDFTKGGQTPVDAVPIATCNANQQGDGGIWICIEDGMATDCQASEFQVTGTQNNNATGTSSGSTGGTMPTGGIHYDFQAPINLPSDFSIDTGDGTVLITWKLLTTGDINGFRVLCADEDGNPLPGKGLDPPPLSQINIGKLYFTKDNLCPNGPFGDDVPQDDTGGTESGGSESGSSSDSGSGSDSGTGTDTGTGTSGGVVDIDEDIIDGFLHASSDSSGSGGSGSGSDTGSAPPVDIPEDGIMSMKWDYVCSGHIGGTSHEAKITGLENGKTYQFAIVAYDLAGNPVVASGDLPLTASPRETLDFWEQCEIDGNVCGEGGFCNCSVEDEGRGDALWLGALAGFAALRRRRRGRR
ncbi:MAG TPA: MYXO-CTERM sorting domain-containing protein [Nannocystaceae bacterium]|nr:MYXO-CTERM sorting domain-containing protein [Nannocystaceae bacterium]